MSTAATQPVAAAAAPNTTALPSYATGSLYVGDLDVSVTEPDLYTLFSAVGPVASVRVCRDAATRRSLGYAYVNFHRVEDAERALDNMNFKPIHDRPCRIMWSHRDPSLRKSGLGNIFVKGLAKTLDNKSLYDAFSVFGNILSCKVSTNGKGESLGYGFVHFESEEAALSAISKVDGKVLAGEKVSVALFKSRKERQGVNKNTFSNLYVKFLPADMTKEKLDALFSKYGKITSSMVNHDKEQKDRVFAFVNYATHEEASAAVEALNDSEFEGKKLYVARAQKKEEREKELQSRFEQLKIERQRKYAGVNLYIKNLTDDIDDERLRNEFSKFGSITSVHVMTDPATQKSRGFGFVCFATADEATKALTEMNGKMLEGKPLFVGMAQRREQRAAQLEARRLARQKGMMGQPMYPQGPMYGYPGMQARGFMNYPQQMRGVPQWPMPGPMMYHVTPLQGANGARPQGPMVGAPRGRQQGGRGGRGGRGGQAIKYTDNVRNQNKGAMQQQAPVEAAAAPSGAELVQQLASAPQENRKQLIGEQLFPRIAMTQPELAGKITGMLLEMDDGELIHLIENGDALQEKVQEALDVLKKHEAAAQ